MKGRLLKGYYDVDLKIKVVLEGLKYRGALAACEKYGVTRNCFDKWLGQMIEATSIHMKKDYGTSDHLVIKLFRKKLLKPYLAQNKKLKKKNEYLKTQLSLIKPFVTGKVYGTEERKSISQQIKLSRLSLIHALRCLNITPPSFRMWSKVTPRKEIKRIGGSKYDVRANIDAVFKLFHTPPKNFGLNRITWKLDDLNKQLKLQGTFLSAQTIRRILKNAGYSFRKASKVLICKDSKYLEKINKITSILKNLNKNESFFSIDEFGPFSVKKRGGKRLMAPEQVVIIPQIQKSKGVVSLIGALDLSKNQMTYVFNKLPNSELTVKLVRILKSKYAHQKTIYLSWDGASHHFSKKVIQEIDLLNQSKVKPLIELAPLPISAQYLNVIEAVYGAMYRAILQNSDYPSVSKCVKAIDNYFKERNDHFKNNPKSAGNKIWRGELTTPIFNTANNCVESSRWGK